MAENIVDECLKKNQIPSLIDCKSIKREKTNKTNKTNKKNKTKPNKRKAKNNDEISLHIDFITCQKIGQIAKNIKTRSHISVKTGKEMLFWIKDFAKKSQFTTITLNSTDDVLGFYWKYGWRFQEFPATQRDCSHNIVAERVEKLNTVNKLITPAKYTEHDEIRNQLLTKYFDRYLEDYYCVQTLSRGNSKGEDYENYEIPDTLTYKRWDMRFQGYPMYWQCK